MTSRPHQQSPFHCGVHSVVTTSPVPSDHTRVFSKLHGHESSCCANNSLSTRANLSFCPIVHATRLDVLQNFPVVTFISGPYAAGPMDWIGQAPRPRSSCRVLAFACGNLASRFATCSNEDDTHNYPRTCLCCTLSLLWATLSTVHARHVARLPLPTSALLAHSMSVF